MELLTPVPPRNAVGTVSECIMQSGGSCHFEFILDTVQKVTLLSALAVRLRVWLTSTFSSVAATVQKWADIKNEDGKYIASCRFCF